MALFGQNGLIFSERGLVYSNPGAPCPECCGSGSGGGGGVCPCCRGDSPASVLLTFTGLSYATCGTAACIPNPTPEAGSVFMTEFYRRRFGQRSVARWGAIVCLSVFARGQFPSMTFRSKSIVTLPVA
ncbi:MAG TPA: hypothetical protein VK797_03155, partial [Tepidisphaeraceae bacterium]|nr:hypothetical protein [Tepidisphaeraceae bacterium]